MPPCIVTLGSSTANLPSRVTQTSSLGPDVLRDVGIVGGCEPRGSFATYPSEEQTADPSDCRPIDLSDDAKPMHSMEPTTMSS